MSLRACSMTKLWWRPSTHDLLAVRDPAALDERGIAGVGGDEIGGDRRRLPEGEGRAARLHEAEQAGRRR